MTKWRLASDVVPLLVAVVLAGCGAPAEPAGEEPAETDAAGARETAIQFMRDAGATGLPDTGAAWEERATVLPEKPDSEDTRFRAGVWRFDVLYPMPPAETPRHAVVAFDTADGWQWKGYVDGDGEIEQIRPLERLSRDESQRIAEKFVRGSATFVFDGIADSLRLSAAIEVSQPYTWTFVFEFDSRQAGYGNRTGQMLAQVITRHEASITVEMGWISYASLDSKWDIFAQSELLAGVGLDSAVVAPTSDFTGFITEIQALLHGEALGIVNAESHADKTVDKYVFTVTANAEIQGLNGDPAAFEDLETTQWIEAWFSEPVKESFPMQVDVGKIVISRTGR